MPLKDPETPKQPCNVDLRVSRCYASYLMQSIFSESRDKGEPWWKAQTKWRNRTSPSNEICRKFLRKITVLANGVKKQKTKTKTKQKNPHTHKNKQTNKQMTASIIDFCSVFNLKLLSLPALVKAKSGALLNNKERDENEMTFFLSSSGHDSFCCCSFVFRQLRVHPKASHFSSPPLFMFSFPSWYVT